MPATTLDADLAQLITDVLGLEIDSEVVVSLIEQDLDEWRWFKHMEVTDVPVLKKSDGHGGFVPCMQSERIEYFLFYIENKKTINDPNSPWWDISSYTRDEFIMWHYAPSIAEEKAFEHALSAKEEPDLSIDDDVETVVQNVIVDNNNVLETTPEIEAVEDDDTFDPIKMLKEETDLSADSKTICIHGSTSKQDLDQHSNCNNSYDNGRFVQPPPSTLFI